MRTIIIAVLLSGCGGKDCVATYYAAGMTFCYDFVPQGFNQEHAELVVTEVERVSHQYYGFSGLREILQNNNAMVFVTRQNLFMGGRDIEAYNEGGFDITIEEPSCLLASHLAHELLHTIELVYFGVAGNEHNIPYMFECNTTSCVPDYELTAEYQIYRALTEKSNCQE